MAKMPTTITIDQLWLGASSQADFQRRPGTVKESKNVRFDATLAGAAKRSATNIIADLTLTGDVFWASIRGAIVAINSAGTVFGWDEHGEPLTVNGSTAAFAAYVATGAGSTVIEKRLATAASFDTLVVANRTVSPAILATTSAQQDIHYILNGDFDDSSGSPPTATNQDTVDYFGPLTDKQIADGFSALPGSPSNGDVYYVNFDQELNPAGYYLYVSGAPHASYPPGYFPKHGDWYRIPSFNSAEGRAASGRYDLTKMPHRIVYSESAGTLTLSPIPWRQKVSGNQATNPPMPWTSGDDAIQSVEFAASRLFLISKRLVTASRKDDFFNLFVDNVNADGDADPIISNASQSRVGVLQRSASLGHSIIPFAENRQLEFGAGDAVLTRTSGRLDANIELQPLDIVPGVANAAAVTVDVFGDVHLFQWGGAEVGAVYSGMLTAHYRRVLQPYTVSRVVMIGQSIFITTAEGPVLTHELFSIKGELVQSAWGLLEFHERPVFIDSWGANVRIVTRDEDHGYSLLTYLHRDAPVPDDMLYMPHLDRMERVELDLDNYSQTTGMFTIPHTGRDGSVSRSMLVIAAPGHAHLCIAPAALNGDGDPMFSVPGAVTFDSDGDPILAEGWNGVEHFLGFTFDTELTPSRLYPGMSAIGVQSQQVFVFHHETTDYRLTFDPTRGDSKVQDFAFPKASVAQIGEPNFDTHFSNFSVVGDPRHMTMTLSSSSPGRVVWMGVEYVVSTEQRGAA